jgi:hypothetical protein
MAAVRSVNRLENRTEQSTTVPYGHLNLFFFLQNFHMNIVQEPTAKTNCLKSCPAYNLLKTVRVCVRLTQLRSMRPH